MAISDPRDIPGLVAWYSADAITGVADGGLVSQWDDLSGNDHHALSLNLPGGNVYRAAGGPGNGPYLQGGAEFGFQMPNGIIVGSAAGEMAVSVRAILAQNGCWELGGNGSGDASFPWENGSIYDSFGSTAMRRLEPTPAPLNQWMRYSARSKAGAWTAWIDGVQYFNDTSNTVAWQNAQRLGRSNSRPFLGRMAAFVLYNRELTTQERADLNAWLAANPSGGRLVVAPDPPTALIATGSTQTSVSASWTAPASGTPVTSYEVRRSGGAPLDVGLDLSHTFTGLAPGTAYGIEVRSIGGGLASSWVGPLLISTLPPDPPAPGADGCYAMVRGSAVRVTELDRRGRVGTPVRFATSTAVSVVTVTEVVDGGVDETMRNPERARRIRIRRPAQTIGYTVDVKFLRVDPGLYSLVAGVPLVYNAAGDVVGFDADARERVTTFALEVWSKLSGSFCADGVQRYGYTLFPSLSGGRIAGFSFANGTVSFTLVGARSSKRVGWGVGPYDLEGYLRRLLSRVSGNLPFRTFVLATTPPTQQDGIQVLGADVVDNGTATNPMPDPTAPEVLDGGGAENSPWIVDGGRA